MKDGAFEALRSDDLPLPEMQEVLGGLVLPTHTKERFRQRARAGELHRGLLRDGRLSRHSPDWRAGEDYARSPDLYLVFPFLWEDGGEDEGCLIIEESNGRYVARTFVSRSSNDAERATKLPPAPDALVQKIARASRKSPEEILALLEKLPVQHGATLPWTEEAADAWIDGGAWAVSLRQELVGAGNPYHYSWGKAFVRHEQRKARSRKSYQRRMKKFS